MTSANRVQLTWVKETTPGTTPNTPRMRKVRYTSESLNSFNPTYDDPDEIRADRMDTDAVLLFQDASGAINVDISYPINNSPLSDFMASTFYNDWVVSPERDNDGTADSVITDIGTVANTIACTTGAAFVVGQLVQFSGNTAVGNNVVGRVTTGSATAPVFSGTTFTADAAPAATSRMKVVGFAGASADITATSTGLASTILDFTTLGLSVGQTLKIGGTAAGDKFATAALNVFVTVAAVAAHALTLSNLPSGWTTDVGTGKTIKVWFGDTIKNGVKTNSTRIAGTIEKGYLGQTVPSYIVGRGNTVSTATFTLKHKDKFRAVFNFMGMSGSESTTTLSASPDAASTNSIISANVNVGRLSEGGSLLAGPNYCRSLEITINNNLRAIEDITQQFPAGLNEGDCTVDAKFETYFGDDTILNKYFNGTPSKIHTVLQKNNQAVAFHLPRLVYRAGTPPAVTGKNTDVFLSVTGRSSIDTTTNSHVIFDRLEYFES